MAAAASSSTFLSSALNYQEGSWAHTQTMDALNKIRAKHGLVLSTPQPTTSNELERIAKVVVRNKVPAREWRPPPGWLESQNPFAKFQPPAVSLGSLKYNTTEAGASIFHANKGTELITQTELPKVWQGNMRAKRAMEAGMQGEVVTLMGKPLRLFPNMTASRALLWGTVIASWFVGATAATAAKSLGVRSVDDIRTRVPQAIAPAASSLRSAAVKVLPTKEAGTEAFGYTNESTTAALASSVRRRLHVQRSSTASA